MDGPAGFFAFLCYKINQNTNVAIFFPHLLHTYSPQKYSLLEVVLFKNKKSLSSLHAFFCIYLSRINRKKEYEIKPN